MCNSCDVAEPMNPEIKALWVDALKSGQYEQGDGNLNADGKFCCLGVLCDIAVKSGLPVQTETEFCCDDCGTKTKYDDSSAYLPTSVVGWAGLSSSDPYVPGTGWDRGPTQLSSLNDRGVPFAEIAELIDGNL